MNIKTPEELLKQRLLNGEIERAAKVLAQAIYAIIEETWSGRDEWTEFQIDRSSMPANLSRLVVNEKTIEILSHHGWTIELDTDECSRFRPDSASISTTESLDTTIGTIENRSKLNTLTPIKDEAPNLRKKSVGEMLEDAVEQGLASDHVLSERCFFLDLNDCQVWISPDVAKIEKLIEFAKLYERDRFIKNLYTAADSLENNLVSWEVRPRAQGIPSTTIGEWLIAEKEKSNLAQEKVVKANQFCKTDTQSFTLSDFRQRIIEDGLASEEPLPERTKCYSIGLTAGDIYLHPECEKLIHDIYKQMGFTQELCCTKRSWRDLAEGRCRILVWYFRYELSESDDYLYKFGKTDEYRTIHDTAFS